MITRAEQMRLIKELRERTNAPVSLCREAIEASAGDLLKAADHVNSHHKPLAPGKDNAGKITTYVHQGRIGVMIEVRCATDFVARTDQFQHLCRELALQAAGLGEDDLLSQVYVRDPTQTVKELIDTVSQQVGEAISVRRVVRWELK
jgi:elongation factor Ts